jgi:hypothetical protein
MDALSIIDGRETTFRERFGDNLCDPNLTCDPSQKVIFDRQERALQIVKVGARSLLHV